MSPRRTTAAGSTGPTVVGVVVGIAVVVVGAAVVLDVLGDTADDGAVARVVDVDAGGAARSEVLQATATNSNATADADARQLGRQPMTSTLR
jgi:hypothetical protein